MFRQKGDSFRLPPIPGLYFLFLSHSSKSPSLSFSLLCVRVEKEDTGEKEEWGSFSLARVFPWKKEKTNELSLSLPIVYTHHCMPPSYPHTHKIVRSFFLHMQQGRKKNDTRAFVHDPRERKRKEVGSRFFFFFRGKYLRIYSLEPDPGLLIQALARRSIAVISTFCSLGKTPKK